MPWHRNSSPPFHKLAYRTFDSIALGEVVGISYLTDQVREQQGLGERLYDVDEDRPFVFQVFGSIGAALGWSRIGRFRLSVPGGGLFHQRPRRSFVWTGAEPSARSGLDGRHFKLTQCLAHPSLHFLK